MATEPDLLQTQDQVPEPPHDEGQKSNDASGESLTSSQDHAKGVPKESLIPTAAGFHQLPHQVVEVPTDDQKTEGQPESSTGAAQIKRERISGIPRKNIISDSEAFRWDHEINRIPMKQWVKKQSVVCNESEQIRCSPLMKEGKLLEYMYDDTRTQHEIFMRGLKVSENGKCIGYRPGAGKPYQWLTYQEVLDRARDIGSGLIAKGAEANSSQFIGIYSQNRVEWSLVEQACNAYSMAIVPLYDTLGLQAMKFIVNQCELQYVVVDKNEKAMNLMQDAETTLKLIVLVEEADGDTKSKAAERGIDLMTISQIEQLGKGHTKEFVRPSPEDLHTICYTSGTTGNPKGVMLSHKAIVATASANLMMGYNSFAHLTSDDVHMSFLPLAHGFEKTVQAMVLMNGGSIGFFQGDIKLIIDDVATLRPTVFPMVPRLLNRIRDRVLARASQSRIKTFFLERGLKSKMNDLKNGIVNRNTIWDRIVFRKVQNLLGGRLQLCVTGAAPVSPKVLNFMRCALGVNFTEGYGQTEAVSAISLTLPGDYKGGNVGSILPNIYAKLVDFPEKNYYAKDNKGELCVKGPILFDGYYKEPEKTKAAVDEDGWLHTGDVAEWLPNGSLKIIDRCKHIFKLAQGEYIAPEKIEQIYVQSAPVTQAFVYGDSFKASLVAIVVPDPDTCLDWLKNRGIEGSYQDICSNPKAASLILKDMNSIGKKNGLQSFEMAKKIFLSPEQFTVQDDLLTPTLKSKRPQILEKYKAQIDELYVGLD